VIVDARSPALLDLLNDILDALPEAFEESKDFYLAKL